MRVQRKTLKSILIVALFPLILTACIHSDDDDDHDDSPHEHAVNFDLDQHQVVNLDAANTNSTGEASLEFHQDENELHGAVTFTGDTPYEVHVHVGYAGQDGEKLYDLTDDDADGSWTIPEDEEVLSQSDIADLEAGRLYINAHFDDGSGNLSTIRGQILVHEIGIATARLSAANDDTGNPITTTGGGFAALTMDEETGAIKSFVTFSSTPATDITGMHIHDSEEKIGIITLTDTNDSNNVIYSTDSAETLDAVGIDQALHGKLYINVHTDDNPNGELIAELPVMTHGH